MIVVSRYVRNLEEGASEKGKKNKKERRRGGRDERKKPLRVWAGVRVAGVKRKRRARNGNYVDCACRIVGLIGLVASNEPVSRETR